MYSKKMRTALFRSRVSVFNRKQYVPRARSSARLFARPKPRFSPFSISFTSGKHSRIMAAEPSREALSTTHTSQETPRVFSRREARHCFVSSRVL